MGPFYCLWATEALLLLPGVSFAKTDWHRNVKAHLPSSGRVKPKAWSTPKSVYAGSGWSWHLTWNHVLLYLLPLPYPISLLPPRKPGCWERLLGKPTQDSRLLCWYCEKKAGGWMGKEYEFQEFFKDVKSVEIGIDDWILRMSLRQFQPSDLGNCKLPPSSGK